MVDQDGYRSEGRVEYDCVAGRYQHGRALDEAELNAWRDAVAPFLPSNRPLAVLDVGAGTGIFSRAWPGWFDCRVVALEPSAGMRTEAAARLTEATVSLVGGVGEAIGLRDCSADVAWLSTVWHHLRDTRACIAELRRVLVPGGVVLLRGLFADLGEVGWLRFFPGAGVARSRYPSASGASAQFTAAGFEPAGNFEVDARRLTTPQMAATWARRMRRADTLLAGMTDEEFQEGVSALEASPNDQPLPNKLALLVFVRR